MCLNKERIEENWISLILRVAMGLLFLIAAQAKFAMGLGQTSGFISGMFKDSFLPSFLVVPYTYLLPFAEALVAAWLLTGYKLRTGWVFTAGVLVSLTFGLMVTKSPTAADMFVYIFISCVGIYVARYDHCVLGGKK
jgi:thiosulfate dehydrogenase [quinone] large subunit